MYILTWMDHRIKRCNQCKNEAQSLTFVFCGRSINYTKCVSKIPLRFGQILGMMGPISICSLFQIYRPDEVIRCYNMRDDEPQGGQTPLDEVKHYIYGKHTISECISRQWLSNFYKNMKGHRIWHHTLTQSKKSFQLFRVQFIRCRTWTPEERTWQIIIFIDQQVVLKKKSST